MYEHWKLNKNVRRYKQLFPDWLTMWMIITLIFILLMCVSCKPVERIVTQTEYKTEYRDRIQKDSIYVQDSVMIREKGDSVWIREVKYKYVDRFLRDTVNITDTVKINITDTKYVTTNKIYWYQKFPMYIGWIAILLCAVWIGIKMKKLWF